MVENNIKLGDDNWIVMVFKLVNGGNVSFIVGIKLVFFLVLIYNLVVVLKVVSDSKIFILLEICIVLVDVKDSVVKVSF